MKAKNFQSSIVAICKSPRNWLDAATPFQCNFLRLILKSKYGAGGISMEGLTSVKFFSSWSQYYERRSKLKPTLNNVIA